MGANSMAVTSTAEMPTTTFTSVAGTSGRPIAITRDANKQTEQSSEATTYAIRPPVRPSPIPVRRPSQVA